MRASLFLASLLKAMPDTLQNAQKNTDVTVVAVGGERAFRRRIMEMGLVPGTRVKVVGVAPLGDPLTLELRSGRLSIRKEEAAQVAIATGHPSK